MCPNRLLKNGLSLLLSSMLLFGVTTTTYSNQDTDHKNIILTGQWMDSRKAVFTGEPILLHLRTGHERALLMPEPVRLSDVRQQSPEYDVEIHGEVVRFYPTNHFDRESIRLTGLDTGTEFVLRVRASAFGIRQPLQIFHAE